MSKPDATFVEKCLSGDAFADDIDDYIDQWHEGAGQGELHEFLGFTEEEYALWVERPEALGRILDARKQHLPRSAAR
jgi:hypothetical protein